MEKIKNEKETKIIKDLVIGGIGKVSMTCLCFAA